MPPHLLRLYRLVPGGLTLPRWIRGWGVLLAVLPATAGGTGRAEPTMAERVAQVASRFSPQPGELAQLDPLEMRDLGKTKPLQVRGFIRVSPKSGECLTIRRGKHYSEQRICNPTSLPFRASDVEVDGSVRWDVLTPKDIDAVSLSWPTPYRIGKRLAAGHRSPSDIKSFILKSCRVTGDSRGPVMRLGLLSGEEWTIHFPKQDKHWPQAPDMPDLYIMGKEAGMAGGITEEVIEGRRKEDVLEADIIEERLAQEKEAANLQQDNEGQNATKGPSAAQKEIKDGETAPAEGAADPHGAKQKKKKDDKPKRPPSKRYQVYEYRGRWTIPQRGSFHLNAGQFKTLNESGETRGTCRYQLAGALKDSGSGWIECHSVGLDEFIFLHLPCADDVDEVRKSMASNGIKATPDKVVTGGEQR